MNVRLMIYNKYAVVSVQSYVCTYMMALFYLLVTYMCTGYI